MRSLERWRALFVLLVAMWLIELINLALGHRLNQFGILPRTASGLTGVVAAPFLHASLSHLASNTAGLVALGGLVALRGERPFLRVSLFIALVGGLATWLLARGAYHVGASLLIFGYFGYLLARGVIERTPAALLVALAVAVLYGGLLWGVLPSAGTSFEGHFFGLIAGVGAASVRIDPANDGQHE